MISKQTAQTVVEKHRAFQLADAALSHIRDREDAPGLVDQFCRARLALQEALKEADSELDFYG